MQHIKRYTELHFVSRSPTYNLEDRAKVQSRDVRTERVKKKETESHIHTTIRRNDCE